MYIFFSCRENDLSSQCIVEVHDKKTTLINNKVRYVENIPVTKIVWYSQHQKSHPLCLKVSQLSESLKSILYTQKAIASH